MSRADAIAAFHAAAARQAAIERQNPAAPAGVRGTFLCSSSGHKLTDETWAPSDAPPKVDVLYLHGVCESADTLPVRNLAAATLNRGWRLCVLEHHGHGGSDGKPCVLISFDTVVEDAAEYISHIVNSEGAAPRFALVGHSLGATAAAYLGGRLYQQFGVRFIGAVLIAPAVGADPDMLPPSPVISLLRCASRVLPSLSLPATPFEEPAGYCASDPPPGLNYRGHWPLGTARVLLDLTAVRVPQDCALPSGTLCLAEAAFPAVIAKGRGDAMVLESAIAPFAAALDAAASAASVQRPREIVVGIGHQPLMGADGRDAANRVMDEITKLAA